MEKYLRNSMEKAAYDKIKTAIIKKILVPGTQLVETMLAEKLSVSRTPLRNAFKKLEEEGFVSIIPNRGAFIIEPDKKEIADAFKVRTELETAAVKFGLNEVTSEDIKSLAEIIGNETLALKNNDIAQYLEINKQFHLFLANKSKNKFLINFLDKILDQINVYLMLYDTYYNVPVEDISGIREHKNIIEFIRKKDEAGLIEYLRFHLSESLDDIKLDKIVTRSLNNL